MDSQKMDYEKLIRLLAQDENFHLVSCVYTDLSFGNFSVVFRYKDSLAIEVLSDRSKIEVSLVDSTFFSKGTVPLEYAIAFLSGYQDKKINYVYDDLSVAFSCLVRSKSHLDEIIERKKLRGIVRKWKRKLFFTNWYTNAILRSRCL